MKKKHRENKCHDYERHFNKLHIVIDDFLQWHFLNFSIRIEKKNIF